LIFVAEIKSVVSGTVYKIVFLNDQNHRYISYDMYCLKVGLVSLAPAFFTIFYEMEAKNLKNARRGGYQFG